MLTPTRGKSLVHHTRIILRFISQDTEYLPPSCSHSVLYIRNDVSYVALNSHYVVILSSSHVSIYKGVEHAVSNVWCSNSYVFKMGKGRDAIPKNWPSSVPYLSQPSFASHLTKTQRESLRVRSPDLAATITSNFPRGPCSLVRIIPINDPSHPAHGQAGLFAARHLEPDTLILPYYGFVHSSLAPHSLTHEKSDYDLWLNREVGVAVDAEKAGNEARFTNDYRGVRDRPNAEFRQCWDMRSGEQCSELLLETTIIIMTAKTWRHSGCVRLA